MTMTTLLRTIIVSYITITGHSVNATMTSRFMSYIRGSVIPQDLLSMHSKVESAVTVEESSLNQNSSVPSFLQRHRQQQEQETTDDLTDLHVEMSIPSQIPKTYVFPRSLNPECAAGSEIVVGVSHFHMEAINRTSGDAIFANSLHWLFKEGDLPRGEEMNSARILHDASTDKFILLATMTDKESYSKLYLAISKNGSPTSGTQDDWDILVMDVWDSTKLWANHLEVSVDNQAIYITATMYLTTIPSEGDDRYEEIDAFVESRLTIVKKNVLLTTISNPRVSNQAMDGTLYGFEGGIIASVSQLHLEDEIRLGPYVPANIPDPTQKNSPVFGTYLVALHDQHPDLDMKLHIIRVSNALSSNPSSASYITSLGYVDAAPEAALPNAQQPLGSYSSQYQPVETGDRHISDAVWHANTLSIATTTSIDVDRTAVFWAKLDAASNIVAPSSITLQVDDDGIEQAGLQNAGFDTSAFHPSIAVNAFGDLVIGYAASGVSLYAGMYTSLATAGDEHHVVSSHTEIHPGEDSYESIDGRAFHGQYSGMSHDPVDSDCFWAFNAFARVNDPLRWHTWERGALAIQWGKVCMPVFSSVLTWD